MREDQTLRTFLESPKIAAAQKNAIIERALARKVPRLFVRYIETVIQKRRQMLIPDIAIEYQGLIDEAENRLHANVTVAAEQKFPSTNSFASLFTPIFWLHLVS